MKTNFKAVLLVICISLFSVTNYAINTIENNAIVELTEIDLQQNTATGTYLGHDATGYIFSVTDKDGTEEMVTFHNVDESVLATLDLKSKTLIEKTFEITFEVTTTETLGSDGKVESKDVHTIKGLKEVSKVNNKL